MTPAQFAAHKAAMGPREKISTRPAARHGTELVRGDPAHLVMGEFLVAVGLIGLRTIGQYEPRAGGTRRGAIVPSKPGGLGPLPMLAATIIVYFILALLAMAGGTRARVAAVLGLVYDLALMLNSAGEMTKLSAHLADVGKGKASPGGGPGPGRASQQFDQPGTGTAPPGSPETIKPGHGNSCPPGYTYAADLHMCVLGMYQPLPPAQPF